MWKTDIELGLEIARVIRNDSKKDLRKRDFDRAAVISALVGSPFEVNPGTVIIVPPGGKFFGCVRQFTHCGVVLTHPYYPDGQALLPGGVLPTDEASVRLRVASTLRAAAVAHGVIAPESLT